MSLSQEIANEKVIDRKCRIETSNTIEPICGKIAKINDHSIIVMIHKENAMARIEAHEVRQLVAIGHIVSIEPIEGEKDNADTKGSN